ncbi:hypothetical protein GCM10010160_66200 [Acrocarpospora corrugata]
MTIRDFEEIGNPAIQKEIIILAEEEVRFPPREHREDEGWIKGKIGEMAWRRAISTKRGSDPPEELSEYCLVYRRPTDKEYREAGGGHAAITVTRILHNSMLAVDGL